MKIERERELLVVVVVVMEEGGSEGDNRISLLPIDNGSVGVHTGPLLAGIKTPVVVVVAFVGFFFLLFPAAAPFSIRPRLPPLLLLLGVVGIDFAFTRLSSLYVLLRRSSSSSSALSPSTVLNQRLANLV